MVRGLSLVVLSACTAAGAHGDPLSEKQAQSFGAQAYASFSAHLTGDNVIEELYLNGESISLPNGASWTSADAIADLPLHRGEKNVLAVKVRDNGGPGGFIADLNIDGQWDGTSEAWKVSTTDPGPDWADFGFDDSGWSQATSYGQYGVGPWSSVSEVTDFPSDSPAEWIWSSDGEGDNEVYLRYEFTPIPRFSAYLTGDNVIEELYLNGESISLPNGASWKNADELIDLPLQPINVLAVKVRDSGGPGGFIADMFINGYRRGTSDSLWDYWKVSTTDPGPGWMDADFSTSGWDRATVHGRYGDGPWGAGVEGFPSDSRAQWIWSSDKDNDNEVYLRHQFQTGPFVDPDAAYNPSLGAPECVDYGEECDSGETLVRRGDLAPAEPNQPNTLDGCSDGSAGTDYRDGSVYRVSVTSLDALQLTEGGTAEIEATILALDSSNYLDFYYAADADNPTWTYISTIQAASSGYQTHSVQYTVPAGRRQAVRVSLRHGGGLQQPSTACPTGGYEESDDLVFAVLYSAAHHVARVAAEVCPDGSDDCDLGRPYSQFISLDTMDVDVVGGFFRSVFGLRKVNPLPASCYDGGGNNLPCFVGDHPNAWTLFDSVPDLETSSATTEHFGWGIYSYELKIHGPNDLTDSYQMVALLYPQDIFRKDARVVVDMRDPACWPEPGADPWASLPENCKVGIRLGDFDDYGLLGETKTSFMFGGFLYYINGQDGAYFRNHCSRAPSNDQIRSWLRGDGAVKLPPAHCGLTNEVLDSVDLLLNRQTVEWVDLSNLLTMAAWQIATMGLDELATELGLLEEAGELTEQGLRLKKLVTALQAINATGNAIMNGMMFYDALLGFSACADNDRACRWEQGGAMALTFLFSGLETWNASALMSELRAADLTIQLTDEEISEIAGFLQNVREEYSSITGEPVDGSMQSKRSLPPGKLRAYASESADGKTILEHEVSPAVDPGC